MVGSRTKVVAVVIAVLCTAAALAAAASGRQAGGLQIQRVSAPDAKSIEVTFNKALSPELLQLAAGNRNYLANYIRVSGDATLDGRALSAVPGTAVWPVDTPAHNTVRIVLGTGVNLTDAPYELWFDGAGDQLSDLYLEAADGDALAGTTTPKAGFRGSTAAAPTAAIASAEATDARTVKVGFGSSILANMPSGRYAAAAIRLAGPAGAVPVTYVQHIAGTDRKQYEISVGSDLDPSATYRLQLAGVRLTTAGGQLPADALLERDVAPSRTAHPAPAIDAVRLGADRKRLTVSLTAKLSALGESITVAETPNGVGGTTLTDDQLRGLFDIRGATDGEGGRGTVAGDLRDVAAYMPDARTIVIGLRTGRRFAWFGGTSVAARAGALRDIAGARNPNAGPPVGARPGQSADAAPAARFNPHGRDYLAVNRHASVTFRHNAFELTNPPTDLSVKQGSVRDKLVNERIDAIEVENKYIKATFVPGYGARLLSLIYKPTGNDLLYTNPVGTPYGISNPPPGQSGTSPFYNNWLMVWGGVFPTVTESEHGKYWFVPWEYSISEKRDSVSITMSKVDEFDYAQRPTRFRYGKTGIKTTVVYTVSKTSPSVDMQVSLNNPSAEAKQYEYWTCTTLAPGAPSTSGSPTMEIVSPVNTIQHDPAYSWMNQVDQPVNPGSGDRMLKLDKLKKMSNWTRDGIAYGQGLGTLPQSDWWGVVNHENSEGVVRVGDNRVTPGMKFWEWGFNSSFDTNVFSRGQSARPYIELWAGTSPRFFTPDVLQPGQTKSWTETFMPTVDLANVTNANRNGSAHVGFDSQNGRTTVTGNVFTTRIGERLRASLVDAASGRVLESERFRGETDRALRLSAKARPGSTVRLVLTDRRGRDVLLTADATAP